MTETLDISLIKIDAVHDAEIKSMLDENPPENQDLFDLKIAIGTVERITASKQYGIEIAGPLAQALGPLYDAQKALRTEAS